MDKIKKKFYVCEKCGKKLIERMPNGLWRFAFGRQKLESDLPENVELKPVVDMLIKGSVKMKCLRRECGHYSILPYFPNSKDFQD
jgi:hypothetical protein